MVAVNKRDTILTLEQYSKMNFRNVLIVSMSL